MTNVLEAETPALSAVKDRRRPGRPALVSTELIPLMRGDAASIPDQPMHFGDPEQLRGARGVAVGVAVSAALWVGLVFLGRSLF
jgi:hypothetical protein